MTAFFLQHFFDFFTLLSPASAKLSDTFQAYPSETGRLKSKKQARPVKITGRAMLRHDNSVAFVQKLFKLYIAF